MYGVDIWLGYTAGPNPQTPVRVDQNRDILVENIVLDIANLLNSRSQIEDLETNILQTPSILDYGTLDVSYYSPYSEIDQQQVCKMLEDTLKRFEPRLCNIKVTKAEEIVKNEEGFHFKIKATVAFGREQIAIILDSKFQNPAKGFVINQGS